MQVVIEGNTVRLEGTWEECAKFWNAVNQSYMQSRVNEIVEELRAKSWNHHPSWMVFPSYECVKMQTYE